MEGQKRSRKAGRSLQRAGKKLTACLLSAAMVLTNVGADVGTAFASDSASEVTFEVAGSELVRAVEEAVAQGNEVQPEDINFTDGKIDRFEKLLFGDGKLYEAYPEFDEDGGVDAYVRVFVNLPEDADDMYMVTGDEELIFLYVNNSDEKISCGTNITRMVDGEEKVKRTSRVTLRSYESAYGDDEEEEEVITQPIASPSDAWEAGQTEGQAPAAEEAAGSEDGTQAPSEETAGEEEEKTEAPEAEVSDHETPVVQAKEDGAQPAVEESVVRILTEEEAEDKAQESESPEESAQAQESEPIEESAQAQESESIEESAQAQESEPIEESTQAQESQSPEESTSEETGSVVEVGTPEETEETKETLPAEELVPAQPQNPEQGTEASQNPPAEPETATPSQPEPAEPQQPEDDGHENNAPEAGRNDLVGIDGCSTAKAVTTTLNKVKAFEDIEGFAVSYELNIEGAARIVEGPRGVEEGEELAFGVKNQLGYAIQSVEVNGQETEAVQIQDNEDGSQTAWYSVPEVSEEQEVYVTLEETAIHPAVTLEPIVMDDGMVITISAEEGVLPDGVTATAVRVSQDVEQAVMDTENAGSEDRTVSSVMAYDINLWLNGQLLDSEIWGGSKRVNVTFSGAPMEAQSGEADAFEVV